MLSSLSKSFLIAWDICQYKAYQEYVVGDRSPANIDMAFGILFHNVVRQMIKSNDDDFNLPLEVGLEKLPQLYVALEDQVNFDQMIDDKTQMIKASLQVFKHEVFNQIMPLVKGVKDPTEIKFEIESPFKLHYIPLNWKGFMDLVSNPEERLIMEWKTTTSKKNENTIDNSYEATLYWWAYKQLYGQEPKSFDYYVFVNSNTKKKGITAELQKISTTRTEEDFEFLKRRVNTILASIEQGICCPASPASWSCNPKKCQIWMKCPYIPDYKKKQYFERWR